jgi:hypothetical protein
MSEVNKELKFIAKLDKKYNDGCFIFLCECFCGNLTEVPSSKFRKGRIRSCGCLRGKAGTHYMTKHPLFPRYRQILSRCYNTKDTNYKHYGARGITVCERWREPMPQGLLNFVEDLGKPKKGQSLERIDNEKGYYPENCMWAYISTQANNKRTSRKITFSNITLTVSQWKSKLKTTEYFIRKFDKQKLSLDEIKEILTNRSKNGRKRD